MWRGRDRAAALRRVALRRRGRVQALAERPQPEMDLTHSDVHRGLTYFGEPDELRLVVNAGAVEVPHEEAERALRCRVSGVLCRRSTLRSKPTAAERTPAKSTFADKRCRAFADRQGDCAKRHALAPTTMTRIRLLIPTKISLGPTDDRKPPKVVPPSNGRCSNERAMLGIPKWKTCHLTSPAGSAGRQVA